MFPVVNGHGLNFMLRVSLQMFYLQGEPQWKQQQGKSSYPGVGSSLLVAHELGSNDRLDMVTQQLLERLNARIYIFLD